MSSTPIPGQGRPVSRRDTLNKDISRIKTALWLSLFMVLSNLAPVLGAQRVVDQNGRTLIFERPFSRIISLYGAHTENLVFLGLDREIIGVSRSDIHDPRFSTTPWFSAHDGPEKFLGARPDLILIRPMIERGCSRLIQQLERSGITVVSLQPADVEGMYDYWTTLGRLTGRNEQAGAMVADFKHQVAGFRALTKGIAPKKQVYFEAIHSKMKTFTPGSMALFALEVAGGINVAKDARASRGTNIGNYGKEQILAHADKIDVFLAQQGEMNPVSRETIETEPGFAMIKAVKNNAIYLIDEQIVSRPGFRLLQGIKTIGEILYPDIFGALDPRNSDALIQEKRKAF
ncbi:Fe(III) ABC-type transporter, periplasmic substrate-binding protein [Desulforapulum autotrophicum HRM2]|uniref:Fe(III) ABC-type transporter, periplasmic substrate-binding protein n=1 Tax=Desulforapulum autotrophicum (strain ATCC 43914 / DSM 3382 / VKM B-1955 / HRM2) TaxID=177437 RepID=C0QFF8_DESAH|nr:Fe(III) ABC-type transporter, periplasmic substrate-binding protein [Desulforapulum autotrophicum HRM2]